MRPVHALRLVLLLLIFGAVGCSSSNKGKIEGTKWSSIAATVKGQAVPSGTLQLEFGTDNKLVYRAGPQTFNGTYSLGSGDSLTMHLTQELAGRKDHTEKVAIVGDKLTMTDSDGTQISFDRIK